MRRRRSRGCAARRSWRRALAALLAARGLEASVEEAPELLPREAQVFWDQGYDHLDLDACIAQVQACVASHLQPGKTGEDDDPRQFG